MATDKPKEGGSFLSTALAVGTAGVGLKYGTSTLFPAVPALPHTGSVDLASQAVNSMSLVSDSIDKNQMINMLNNTVAQISDSSQRAEVLRTALTQALKSSDPMVSRQVDKQISALTDMPSANVQKAIEDLIRTRANRSTMGLLNNFQRNVNTLSRHLKITGTVPTLESVVAPMPTAVSDYNVPKGIQDRVGRIAKLLGSSATPKGTFYSTAEYAKEGLGTIRYSIPAMGRMIDLDVPLANKGMMMRGISPRSRFIAPGAIVADKAGNIEQLTRHELYLSEVESFLTQNKVRGPRQFRNALAGIKQNVYNLEAVSALPASKKTLAEQRYEATRSSQVDLFMRREGKLYRPSEEERIALQKSQGLHLGTSPQDIAMGRLQRRNLAKEKLTPSFAAWERRVENSFRQWGLTPASIKRLESSGRYGRFHEAYASGDAASQAMANPHLKVLYADFSDPKVRPIVENLAGEGEVIGRRGLENLLEFETTKTKRLTEVSTSAFKAIEAGTFSPKIGEVLGRTEAGELLSFDSSMKIVDATIGSQDIESGFMTLNYTKAQRFESGIKLFADMKETVTALDDMKFNQMVQRLTRTQVINEGYDMIMDINVLKKNQGLLTKQMLTGFGEVLAERNIGSKISNLASRLDEISSASAAAKEGGLNALEHFTNNMMKGVSGLGSLQDLTPKEFGDIFGGAYHVLPEERFSQLAIGAFGSKGEEFINYMGNRPSRSTGVIEAAYAGPGYHSAYKMGTLEPRLQDVLRSGPLSGIEGLAEDIATRSALGESEKYAVNRQLERTLTSLTDPNFSAQYTGIGRFSIEEAALKGSTIQDFGEFVKSGGGMMDVGKGFAPVYVPGADMISPMRSFKVGGKTLQGALETYYTDLADEASRMYSNVEPLSPEEFKTSSAAFRKDIWKQYAPGGKGMGGYLRGKTVGSRALLAKTAVMTKSGVVSANMLGGLNTLGISMEAGESMIKELGRSGLYDSNVMADMLSRFKAGEEVTGLSVRHPVIGQYSAQAAGVQGIKGMIDPGQVLVPEIVRDVQIDGQLTSLRLGQTIGQALDKDADTVVVNMLAPNYEKDMRQFALSQDSQYMQDYAQHQVRYQLLKSKAAATASVGDMSLADLMESAGRKLATPHEQLGALSVQLTEAKRAVQAAGKGTSRDALSILEWLEQTPISGKHLKHKQVLGGEFSALLGGLSSGFKHTRAQDIQGAIDQMVTDDVAKRILNEGVSIDQASGQFLGQALGTKPLGKIEGFQLPGLLESIMEDIRGYRESGGAKAASIMEARVTPNMAELGNVFGHPSNMASNLSGTALESINRLGAMGQKIVKSPGGLVGLGFAGALALSTILSRPASVSKANPAEMPPQLMQGGYKDRMNPEVMRPAQQRTQMPGAPRISGSYGAPISPNRNQNYTTNLVLPPGLAGNQVLARMSQRFHNFRGTLFDFRGIDNPYLDGNKE